MTAIHVQTKKVIGGWRIVVVKSNWDSVRVGNAMQEDGYFGYYDDKIFSSRKAAREDLKRYKRVFPDVKITGGLH